MVFPPHHDGQRFFNPNAPGPRGMADVVKWLATRKRESSPDLVPVRTSEPPPSVDFPALLTTMVNHSTVLLQQPGANILTDPIWSARCSPVAFVGPRRHRIPGVDFEHLPVIHIVLLSHDHYDHLDLPTLRRIARRSNARFVAPLGVGAFLKTSGIGPVDELDWGDSITAAGVTIHATPAFHFSGRSLFDRDRRLWCGYMIDSAIGMVYFAADTGFGPHFAWIRERFGSPRLALLPIGAYEPRWFMSPVHMSPDEAIEAHSILGSVTSIPIHWGTFQLADESIDAPRRRLECLAAPHSFCILDNGQSVLLTRC